MTSNSLRGLLASSGLVILAVVVAFALLSGGPRAPSPSPATIASAR